MKVQRWKVPDEPIEEIVKDVATEALEVLMGSLENLHARQAVDAARTVAAAGKARDSVHTLAGGAVLEAMRVEISSGGALGGAFAAVVDAVAACGQDPAAVWREAVPRLRDAFSAVRRRFRAWRLMYVRVSLRHLPWATKRESLHALDAHLRELLAEGLHSAVPALRETVARLFAAHFEHFAETRNFSLENLSLSSSSSTAARRLLLPDSAEEDRRELAQLMMEEVDPPEEEDGSGFERKSKRLRQGSDLPHSSSTLNLSQADELDFGGLLAHLEAFGLLSVDMPKFGEPLLLAIDEKVREMCDAGYEEPVLDRLSAWLDSTVVAWLKKVLVRKLRSDRSVLTLSQSDARFPESSLLFPDDEVLGDMSLEEVSYMEKRRGLPPLRALRADDDEGVLSDEDLYEDEDEGLENDESHGTLFGDHADDPDEEEVDDHGDQLMSDEDEDFDRTDAPQDLDEPTNMGSGKIGKISVRKKKDGLNPRNTLGKQAMDVEPEASASIASTKSSRVQSKRASEGRVGRQLAKLWERKARHRMYEQFGLIRISELFEIIVEYPESEAAVSDLARCLEQVDLQLEVIQNARGAFQRRLLLPGASSLSILETYVTTIKVLRQLDPSGIAVDIVGSPIRDYLAKRDDTIPCIIRGLVNESSSELFRDLARSLQLPPSLEMDPNAEAAALAKADDEWNPAPIRAKMFQLEPMDGDADDALDLEQNRRTQDTLSLLVNIYGSSELFVNEYKVMLGDKLFGLSDFDVERDVQHVEMLKRRFGETLLNDCEIMIMDVMDSKRLAQNLRADEGVGASLEGFQATLMSYLFWPSAKATESFNIPEAILKQQEIFVRRYQELKKPRTVEFLAGLGSVELELTFPDGSRTFQASPADATLLTLYDERPTWTLDELVERMGAPVSFVRSRVHYWLTLRVLKSTGPDLYEIVSRLAELEAAPMSMAPMLLAGEDGDAEDDTADAEMAGYITGFVSMMLATFGHLSCERIHNNLINVLEGYSLTLPQLNSFLDEQVQLGKLEFVKNEYKVAKNPTSSNTE